MNEKQIAFIICTNNMQYYSECVRYIEDLEVPDGYSTDIICVQEAESMTQGYNAGMRASEAKYKVYLHHDTYILNTHFLYDILDIFKDERIGMIGVLGARELAVDANCYLSCDVGSVLVCNTKKVIKVDNWLEMPDKYMPVAAVDGLIMITQVDVTWREDFLDGWDFYDVSQSLEMRKKGYQVVVPYQKEPWCYHDSGESKLKKYDYYRHKMIKKYPEYFKEDESSEKEQTEQETQDYREQIAKIREGMDKIFATGAYDELCSFANDVRGFNLPDTRIQELTNLMDIYQMEKRGGRSGISEWWGLRDCNKLYKSYQWVRFVLLRAGYQKKDERIEELKSMVEEGRVSKDAIRCISAWTLAPDERENIYEVFFKKGYTEPLVSVVIAVYNGAGFVRETIESVLNQTYKNMEIIIIDDASTDNSREIINSYHDVRIKTIFLEKNRNICYAGNIGFQAARGTYVALIGHDDIWVSTKLEKQVAFMEEHPAYSVCFTWVDFIDEEGEKRNQEYDDFFCFQNKPADQWIREMFFYGNRFCASSACIRKKILDKAGYYHYGLVQLQDYELWMRLLCCGSVFIICESLTLYRRFSKGNQNLSCVRNQNLSYVNTLTINRTKTEILYAKNVFLDWISDEQFVWIFGRSMKNKDSKSEKEIQCEKAFLLYEQRNDYFVERFMKLLEDDEAREILAVKFKFELTDFYKMTAETKVFDH